jgi:hypothetical protein
MKTKFDWNYLSKLPDVSQEALKNYFLYALPPGGFLTSLLSCDPWTDVIARADHWNKSRLHEYLMWLQEYAPAGSWGHRDIVANWLDKGPAYLTFQKSVTWDILNADQYEDRGYDF